jgi:hypothetical protein
MRLDPESRISITQVKKKLSRLFFNYLGSSSPMAKRHSINNTHGARKKFLA